MEKNSVLTGLIIGVCVPILGYVIAEYIFEILMNFGLMDQASASTSTKRFRTIALFAICFNLIPLHVFKNKGWVNSMRGIVFPTLIYVGFWVYKFAGALFM